MNMDAGQNKNQTPDYTSINAEIENARASLSATHERLAELERALARGTNDVTAQAIAASAPPQTTIQLIEAALRSKTMDLRELATTIGVSAGTVSTALNDLRRTKKVWNVGSSTAPRWTWRIGDGTSTEDLKKVMRRLMTEQPMMTVELVAATGARSTRISGCLVDFERTEHILNLGTPRRGRWFLVPRKVETAKLAPKAKK